MKQSYFSHGKLLLTGEYLVLDGAKGLALPTHKGQELKVDTLPGSGNIHWTARDFEGNVWLNFSFILQEDHLIPVAMGTLDTSPEVISLKKVLENAMSLHPEFLNTQTDYEISTLLQFPGDWGLGSSSTLIVNIAKWANVDPIRLFLKSWEGSGYDIAVAVEGNALLYQWKDSKPGWEVINYRPPFADQLYFVHLGNKQNSRTEIEAYKLKSRPGTDILERVNEITQKIIKCHALDAFEALMTEHESILSKILEVAPVKQSLFEDYPGAVKSLGAWGGDFIMATGELAKDYFVNRGYKTVLGWEEMIKD